MRNLIYNIALIITSIMVMGGYFCANAQTDSKNVIYTGELANKVYGYGGKTPLNIHIENGVITEIEALENHESPQYFSRATGKIFPKFVGKTVDEALSMQVDAVTGATYSSEALIENIRAGLTEAKAKGLATGEKKVANKPAKKSKKSKRK